MKPVPKILLLLSLITFLRATQLVVANVGETDKGSAGSVASVMETNQRSKVLVATVAETDKRSWIRVDYDAKKLSAELAFYPEVQKADFYYTKIFPRAFWEGTATLSTGQEVLWFHYECGGLYLRFKDGTERYFLHPNTVDWMNAEKKEESKSPQSR